MAAVLHPTVSTVPHSSEETASLLHTRIHAMTVAAHAKDDAVASLASNLRAALESSRATADQLSFALERNRSLEQELQQSRSRQEALEERLSEVLKRLENAGVAEERLAFQIGDLEAESFQNVVENNKLVRSLNARLNETSRLLEENQLQLQRRNSFATSGGQNVEAPKVANCYQPLEKMTQEVKPASKTAQLDFQEAKNSFITLQEALKAAVRSEKHLAARTIEVRGMEVKLQRLLRLF